MVREINGGFGDAGVGTARGFEAGRQGAGDDGAGARNPLITRYRPDGWDYVIGQDAAVTSLCGLIERGDAQTFLLVGPSGTGKTTCARIAAKDAGCGDADILEFDSATYTGIDAMRSIQDVTQYVPFGAQRRAIILDEVHGLSKQAWNSLLKSIEEPPSYILWFLCTTDASKVPETVKTRSATIRFKPVIENDLFSYLDWICEQEGITLADGVDTLVVREAHGSVRQMLANLAVCSDADSRATAAELLRSAIDSDPVIALCRFMAGSGSWATLKTIIGKLDGTNPESVRIVVLHYFASAAKSAKTPGEAHRFLDIMSAFAQPYSSSEGIAPLLLSIRQVAFPP
jgi:DNA polymerase III gamma/tau subunit